MDKLSESHVREKVYEFLAEAKSPDNNTIISLDSNLINDVGLDSVDLLTFTIFLEDYFGESADTSKFTKEDFLNYQTPRDWIKLILNGPIKTRNNSKEGIGTWVELPYGPNFHFIDKVERFSPTSRTIETLKHFRADDPQVRDHIVGKISIVPGIFLVEQVNQTALLLGLNCRVINPGEFLPVTSLSCRFEATVPAGKFTHASVTATDVKDGRFNFTGLVSVEQKIVAFIEGVAGNSFRSR